MARSMRRSSFASSLISGASSRRVTRSSETIAIVESLLPYYGLENQAPHFIAAYEALPIKALTDLAVNGTILMETFNKKGGIWLKEALLACETAVINQEVVNEQAALLEFLQETQSHLVSL